MIVIRECAGFEELQQVVHLQEDTWGYDQTDIIPRKAFLVMQKVGGQVSVAHQRMGISRKSLYDKINKYQIELSRLREKI